MKSGQVITSDKTIMWVEDGNKRSTIVQTKDCIYLAAGIVKLEK